MTDQSTHQPTEPRLEQQPESVDQRHSTGHPEVDDVLTTLDTLADRPAAEHVAVFEAAHERLRGALADAADATPAPAHP